MRISLGDQDADLLSSELWDAGTNGVAQIDSPDGEVLLAGFEEEAAADAAAQRFSGNVEPVDTSVWAQTEASTVFIRRDGARQDDSAPIELTLEVGTAFGHGEHPTTSLILRAIEKQQTNGSVLDVGCGTGVLGLAAAALGASSVLGVDIDAEAVAIANRNAAANDLACGFTTMTLDEVGGSFDLVVANILLAEIRPLRSDILARMNDGPHARLILSGSLIEQRDELLDLFSLLRVIEEDTADGWLCLILAR